MNRYLCLWLPNLPVPNEPPSGVALEPSGLEAIVQLVQQQICPAVAIESLDKKPWAGHPAHRTESLLCEISGVTHLFGGEAGLLGAVDQTLASRRIDGSMAIADSVGAAWAIAHSPIRSPSSSTMPSKVPSKVPPTASLAGPTPTRIIPVGKTRQALEPLPVESLRIGIETAETLSRLGVHSVGQLLQLPRSGLAPRLGQPLVRRLAQALGEIDEPLTIYHPPVEHVAVHRLEYQTSDQRILADRMARLTKEVRAGMANCQRGALRMTCRLDLTDHPPLTLEIGLFAPTIDAEHLCGLLVNRIETIRLPSPVQQLTLSVPLTAPLRSIQNHLFSTVGQANHDSPSQSMMKNISRLVDSLSGRLGCESVVGVKLKDNPLPEQAFSVSPLAGTGSLTNRLAGTSRPVVRSNRRGKSSSDFATTKKFPSPEDAMRRPLSLLTKPMSIAVANHQSPFRFEVASSDLPERIRIGSKIHRIVRAWGSERIETSWWNGPSIRRDYYRIETDSAQWWWIFRDLAAKQEGYRWMLHGKFN